MNPSELRSSGLDLPPPMVRRGGVGPPGGADFRMHADQTTSPRPVSVTEGLSVAPADLDDLDRRLIHALHIDGRAPFSKIGALLGVSTQTVSRRYWRLYVESSLRVVGVLTPEQRGQAQWMVRLSTDPRVCEGLAYDLARRPETSWVKLASGGTNVFAVVTAPAGVAGVPRLLRDIPRAASITGMSAHYVLHTYLGGPTAWRGRTTALDDRQQAQLRRPVSDGARSGDRQTPVGGIIDLLPALQRDGRTSLVDLAQSTGWSPAKVARRLEDLQSSGALFFDVEIDDRQLGVNEHAVLWMSVAPSHLDKVGTALAQHHELAFVAATTGPTNLVAHALFSGPQDLHDYLIHRLGALEEILSLEIAPVLRTVKATGTIVAGEPEPTGPRNNAPRIPGQLPEPR